MASYKMRGSDLYDARNHKVATIRGDDIYDERNHKVATVRSGDVYDDRNHKIASVGDVKKTIDGAMGGTSVVGLWLFFVR
ncbi:MAG: hypothetical protein ABII79_08575 [bacterium]